jgi:N-formylglutamate amidohydrolase
MVSWLNSAPSVRKNRRSDPIREGLLTSTLVTTRDFKRATLNSYGEAPRCRSYLNRLERVHQVRRCLDRIGWQ